MSYDPSPGHDFFVILGGAAAALTGVIFVALATNGPARASPPGGNGHRC